MATVVKKILSCGDTHKNGLALNSLREEYNFEIQIKKLRRARRMTLRVCQVTGELRVTTPLKVDLVSLKNFINFNLEWINTQIRAISPLIPVVEGLCIPIFGTKRVILADAYCEKKYCLDGDALKVPMDAPVFKKCVKSALTQIAEEFFIEVCNAYAQKIGMSYSQISIRDPKSRWGSCSSEKKLMFSWRLIMAPKAVGSYVAAHEVAHLIYMDHSKDFWKLVNFICPSYVSNRNWLRDNGRKLHKFVF